MTVFNTRRKPFDDVRVRQAIALTVDRQAAIEKALGGEGQLTGPVPPGHGDWAIPPESLPYRKDLALAKHLLGEAGHADGFEATIQTTPDVPSMLGTANLLADQAQALGITLKVEQMDAAALAKAVAAHDFDVASAAVGFLRTRTATSRRSPRRGAAPARRPSPAGRTPRTTTSWRRPEHSSTRASASASTTRRPRSCCTRRR